MSSLSWWRSESGTNTQTFRRNTLPRSKARSSSKLVHFLQTEWRQIYKRIRLNGEFLAYLSDVATFSNSPSWLVPLLCTVAWHGSPILNYATVGCKVAAINFRIHPTPRTGPWIKTSLIYILISLTSLCSRYLNTTSLWILHRPGLSDTRQIACQILKTTLHLGLQRTTSRFAVVLNLKTFQRRKTQKIHNTRI